MSGIVDLPIVSVINVLPFQWPIEASINLTLMLTAAIYLVDGQLPAITLRIPDQK